MRSTETEGPPISAERLGSFLGTLAGIAATVRVAELRGWTPLLAMLFSTVLVPAGFALGWMIGSFCGRSVAAGSGARCLLEIRRAPAPIEPHEEQPDLSVPVPCSPIDPRWLTSNVVDLARTIDEDRTQLGR
jgi:hypothetical protein